MIKRLHRACVVADVPLVRAYDLRHSFATEMYRPTGDPKATAAMLMHSEKSRMMDRCTIGGVAPRLQQATKAFGAAVPALEIVAGNRGRQAEDARKTA